MTPSGGFWGTQSRRRLAVLFLYLGYTAALGLSALTTRGQLPLSLGTGLSAIAALAALFGLIGVIRYRRILFLPSGGSLDERQQAVRDRGYSLAYLGLGAIAVFSVAYMALAHFGRVQVPGISRGEVLLLLAGVVLLVLTLPSAMMAWTEPDPPEDSGAYNQINRRSL